MKIFSELSLCLGLILAIAPWIHAQDIPWDDVDKTGSDLADLATRDASDVTNAPAGSIAATDAQAAINELDTEKATTAQGALADSATQPGDNVSTLTNDSGYLTTALANPQFAARSPDSGIVFTTTGTALNAAVLPSAGPRFIRFRSVIPATGSQALSGPAMASLNSGSAVVSAFTAQFRSSNGRIRVHAFGGTYSDFRYREFNLAAFVGGVADVVIVTQGASVPLVYVNGLVFGPTSGSDVTGGSAPAWSTLETLAFSEFLEVGMDNWAASIFEHGNVALTAAEVLTLHRFGWAALPKYVHAAGAGVALISPDTLNGGFETAGGGGNTFSSWSEFTSGTSSINDETSVVHSGSNALRLDLDGAASNAAVAQGIFTAGNRYRVAFWARNAGGSARVQVYSNSTVYSSVLTTDYAKHSFDFTPTISSIQFGRFAGFGQNDSIYIDDITVTPIGVAGSWDFSAGAGYQQRDLSGGKRPMTLTTTGVQRLRPDRQGSVTGSLTWADTHEAKSLLGQKALPSNAIIDAITFVATAGSTGDGITIGTTTDPDQFVTVNTYTTTAENFAGSQLTSPFPGGTATNDLTIVVDPDTANYTGSITTTVTYHLANY